MSAAEAARAALFVRDGQIWALSQVAGRLHWDQETMMPKGAGEQRAEEIAALEEVLHERRADPAIGAWLTEARPRDEVEAARLRLIARAHRRATAIPARLAGEIARLTSLAHGIWAQARADEDIAAFLPILSQIIDLRREEAAHLARAGQSAYDALIDDYEPDMSAAQLQSLFADLRPPLVALRAAILERPAPPALDGDFDLDAQLRLTRKVAEIFGYDLTRGRIDLAVHPFSSGGGRDARITTRLSRDDPFGALYSTIHEVGHACYEQNIAPDFAMTALGQGVSMGVHESQSRIYENQLGRSQPFCHFLHGLFEAEFGAMPVSPEGLYAAINRVSRGHIRTEADEVQYNLHVMLRFDLEAALIGGDLAVKDLEAAWNDRFLADFGFAVDRPSRGMLQDVHWSAGLFGYFPTYSLGNVYAGCLHAALRADLPDLDRDLAQGNLNPATQWLAQNLQRFGSAKTPTAVIEDATGGAISPQPLVDYLTAKFSDLYAL